MIELKQKGIYKITCVINNKCYIGSTWQCFIKRFWQHENELLRNKHKNTYLQKAWVKYGKDNFVFEILEIVVDKKLLLDKEQYWIDIYDSCNKEKGYNLNKYASGGVQFTEESIKKRSLTFTNTMTEAMVYYYNVKTNQMSINEVPDKYKKIVSSKLNFTAWNRGLTKKDIDYSFLKVSKTQTEKLIKSRKKVANILREKRTPYIEIYDADNNYIMTFRSAKDIQEWSMEHGNILPMILKNPNGRNGHSAHILKSANILNCCHGKVTLYKGLMFKFKSN